MAHFAKIENNKVISILVVSNDVLLDENGKEYDTNGIELLISLTGHTHWVQTSYNSNFRNKFAVIGDTYDPEKDVFIGQQPYQSWVFNDDLLAWEAPIPMPADGMYTWTEKDLTWKKIN